MKPFIPSTSDGMATKEDKHVNKALRAGFSMAAEPMMKWLNENMHPHAKVIIDGTSAELVEVCVSHITEKFLGD